MRIRDIKAHCNLQITDMMINGGDEGLNSVVSVVLRYILAGVSDLCALILRTIAAEAVKTRRRATKKPYFQAFFFFLALY
ncbi:hypothetical protein IFM89_001630 [Coptis chinensis]|uniref:Uncharacterized protein n=1 Tax=Coptis chinensis TaxID=261450 RepID=A0A835HHS3_9MAGN|nr:hypothetical protein IFM89_001630 [Coptis chinensis]